MRRGVSTGMEASRGYGARVSARRDELLPLAAALLTVALWASAFVGIRSAGRDLSPGALTLCRLAVGAIALGAVIAIRREPLPTRRDLPAIVACGVV